MADPVLFGYERVSETGALQPQLMCQSPAAPELLNNLVCDCANWCAEDCSCHLNEQTCIVACTCEASMECLGENVCSNPLTVEVVETLRLDEVDSD